MELRVLGQIEASDQGSDLDLGPPKQRALLARLALGSGRTVRLEQLLDDLWDQEPPRSAPKMVQIYVSQLRKVLPGERLRTEGGGYRLVLEHGERDVDRVEELRARARAAAADGDPETASHHLAQALALWRGPALGDLDEPFAERERARLEELRMACLEERIEADIEAGASARVIGELEALIGEHPVRENLRAQLMRALYRGGRQAEALAVYRAFRGELQSELGLEPSDRLRELEAAILRQEPALMGGIPPPTTPPPATAELPGRGEALEALASAFAEAAAGRRRTLFVTGPAGIGKTALVDAFLGSVEQARVGRGQCVAASGGDEAYLPFLDALADLAEERDAESVIHATAPTWAVHVGREVPESVAAQAAGATSQRMMRQAAQVLEALAHDTPLVLVLEDLQWADEATLELLGALMRRSRGARLLVIGTVRADEGAVQAIVHEGCGQRLADRIVLGALDVEAVATVLEQRLGAAKVEPALAGVLHDRCGGNPLFVGLVVDHWVAEHAVAVSDGVVRPAGDIGELAVGVPPTIRASLEVRFARVAPGDREILEAAAVCGSAFAPAAVAAAAGRSVADARRRLEAIAGEHRMIARSGDDAFTFVHELHRDALRDLMGAAREAALHRRLGAHLEAAPDAAARAAEVALHLIEGGDPAGAVRFLRLGAQRALARNAHGIGIRHLRRALEIVGTMPGSASRARLELELLTELGQAIVGRDGWSAPAAEQALVRARGLAETLGDNEPLLSVLLALGVLYEVRGDLVRAEAVIAETLRLAPQGPPGRGIESHELLACNLFHQGAFVRAIEHADHGVAVFEEGVEDGTYWTFPAVVGDNVGIACHEWAALALWFLGFPDQALERAHEAVEAAQAPERHFSLALGRAQMAAVHQCRGEAEPALHWADAALDAATELGYAYRMATSRVLRGWARVRLGEPEAGLDDLVCGLAEMRETGARLHEPLHLGMLTDAYLQVGEPQTALRTAGHALELAARERSAFYQPELHRLRAVALSGIGAPDAEVEAALEDALALARRQASLSLELRATLTLAGLWSRTGRAAAARAAVTAVHARFGEGHDTPDLRAAAALLAGSLPAT